MTPVMGLIVGLVLAVLLGASLAANAWFWWQHRDRLSAESYDPDEWQGDDDLGTYEDDAGFNELMALYDGAESGMAVEDDYDTSDDHDVSDDLVETIRQRVRHAIRDEAAR